MQTNLLWSGREYYSLENCLANIKADGVLVKSTILGCYEEKIYRVEYVIKANKLWETIYFEINSWHDNKTQLLKFNGDGKGNWTSNGECEDKFAGCIDVDIPLTPFTNTLPIKRLNLSKDQSQEIKVIYCDVLAGSIKPVSQKYTCIAYTLYHYENVPNDFDATIRVDNFGFVVDYPYLFVRKAALNSHYNKL